ncbi:DUF4402 domain-containing protein [Altererythrobacter luteolus]|uniref:DUF4402 domain-containing protein n=2 Tax=Pontixanthobacter luteolus TaxID=295089 RepID=A0A6I4V3N9_9SPHN|nr:DUF4402 domain-containing protein [Pontixanthobacter luteolus]
MPAYFPSGQVCEMASTASLSFALRAAGSALALTLSAQAVAAPGDTHTLQGQARVRIIEPIGIQNVADLRFGRIMQPATAGTVSIGTDGAVTETGGAIGSTTTPQLAGGQGAGSFAVFGDPRRRFIVTVPLFATISNGTSTMLVDQFQWMDSFGFGFGRMDTNGVANLSVGARLNVGANQQVGTYSGTYDVTVLYL